MIRQSMRTAAFRVAVFAGLLALWPAVSQAGEPGAAIVPTLDPLGLAGLVAALGGAGWLSLRARRRGK